MNKGRIIKENKTNYVISSDGKEMNAIVRGTFHIESEYPKVGDYVEYKIVPGERVMIEKILSRKTTIIRKTEEGNTPQIIVTNVDVMFIVMGLDNDFNLNRLDRYVLLAEQSRVKPVIILTKSDIVDNPSDYLDQVKKLFPKIETYTISTINNLNMKSLTDHISKGITAVLIGSSGAGKSTITNWLLDNETQVTGKVREYDSRGRHTTTFRQLFTLSSGGYLIDTPGMRGLGLADDMEEDSFEDVKALSNECSFAKCDHDKTEGCAIKDAVSRGDLNQNRVDNFLKLGTKKTIPDFKVAEKKPRKKKGRTQKYKYQGDEF